MAKSWMRGCGRACAGRGAPPWLGAGAGTSAPSCSAEPRRRSERTAALRGRSQRTMLSWRTCITSEQILSVVNVVAMQAPDNVCLCSISVVARQLESARIV